MIAFIVLAITLPLWLPLVILTAPVWIFLLFVADRMTRH